MPAVDRFRAEMYGVPDIEARGFKISLDRHGAPFDPDTDERVAGQTLPAVRDYMARRFPALRNAPLAGAEVCQYRTRAMATF